MNNNTIALQIHYAELAALSLIVPSCQPQDPSEREAGHLTRELSRAEALGVIAAIEAVLGARELWAESRHGAYYTYTVAKARAAVMAGNTWAYSPSSHLRGMNGRLSRGRRH